MSSMVTVIIPTFNRAYCLPLAISSVLAQTYKCIELIIIDDNSSDSTGQVCKRFCDEFGDKIRYLRNDENLGPSRSRNIGISLARGKYITFLDSDDLYYLDKIQLQVDILEKNQSIGFSYGHFSTTHDICDTRHYHYSKWSPLSDLYPFFLLPRNFFVVTPAVMLRSDLLKKVGGFDPSMSICEDLELWSRVLLETQAMCITRPLVIIHIRKNEEIQFMRNILARDQLYQRIFSRDPGLDDNFKKLLYSELIDLYLSISQTQFASPCVMESLKMMRNACKKPFEAMRSEIIQLANKCVFS